MNKVKKLLIFLVFFLLTIGLVSSCKKETKLKPQEEKAAQQFAQAIEYQPFEETVRNIDFENFTLVVSSAIERSIEFREILKEDALLQFDGDYDVLLETFMKKSFVFEGAEILIGEFLANVSMDLEGVLRTDNNPEIRVGTRDYIKDLVNLYPIIQVSIPVHAEEWDVKYTPVTTFITEEFDEKTTTSMLGYRGTSGVVLDAIIIPEEAVIVIGLCERIDDLPEFTDVSATLNLAGTVTESGLRLSWTTSNVVGVIAGYNIYRKENGFPNFELIYQNNDVNNMTYDDILVSRLTSYTYYVQAYSQSSLSNISNIISLTAPDVPVNVVAFDALVFSNNNAELRWEYPAGQYIYNTKISRKINGVDNTYNPLATFGTNDHDYTDNNIVNGVRINYKAEYTNNMGVSNPKYDFVYVPYRDISIFEPVRIKKISYDQNYRTEFEAWAKGKAEFTISVAKANKNGQSIVIKEKIHCDFSSMGSSETFNSLVCNWMPVDWMEVYTFKVYERDNGPDVDVNIKATYKTKNSEKTNFGVEGSVNVKIEDILNKRDDEIGTGTLEYISPVTTEIEFSDYSFKIKISNQ